MSKQESPLTELGRFLPPNTYDIVAPFFQAHTIHLTLTHHRRSLHGDYRAPTRQHPFHRISVNATLNPYSFLITLLHEIAHLTTTVKYGLKASPHGAEWKGEFRRILMPLMGQNIFSHDVENALRSYLHNPAASTCTDPQLYKALAKHDAREEGKVHADAVPVGGRFELGGKIFVKLENLRTRSRCKEEASGRLYFVQGIAEVRLVE